MLYSMHFEINNSICSRQHPNLIISLIVMKSGGEIQDPLVYATRRLNVKALIQKELYLRKFPLVLIQKGL